MTEDQFTKLFKYMQREFGAVRREIQGTRTELKADIGNVYNLVDGIARRFDTFELSSGSVIAQPYRRHRHQEFLRFLKLIDAAVPADLDLVLDNYATHKTPEIHKWLLRHPRFHLHFTPTSSSWLNLVEQWFAELTTRKLRRSAHRSVTELENDIRKWINEWNKGPRPFVWTKTADEILEILAAYCGLISDTSRPMEAPWPAT